MNYTYKQIWLINFPVMMSILMEQLINITDAVFLGHVGEIELGASAIAGIYYLAIYMLGFGFSIGLQVMIARRNGEQHYKETGMEQYPDWYYQKKTHKGNLWYKQLPSQTVQETCKQLDKAWKSFYVLKKTGGIKDPNPPRFKQDNIPITYMQMGIRSFP